MEDTAGRQAGTNTARSLNARSKDEIERGVHSALRQRLGDDTHSRYFAGQTRLSVLGRAAKLAAPSRFHAQMLDRRFNAAVREAISLTLGSGDDDIELSFEVDPGIGIDREPTESNAAAARARPEHDRAARMSLSSAESGRARARRAIVEPFLIGKSNQLAYDAAQRLPGPEGDRLCPLVVHGPCGVGKTHLLRTAASLYRRAHPRARIRSMTADAFTSEFVSAIRNGGTDAFRRSLRGVDLLCIDDVHFLSSRDATQGELVQTLDVVASTGARVVLVSDEHPKHIRSLRAALRSRLVAGMVVRVDAPDPDLRTRLAKHFALRQGFELSDEAATLVGALAGSGESPSVRELMGAIKRIEAARSILHENARTGPVGPGLVRQALATETRSPTPERGTGFDQILHAVCDGLSVDPRDLGGSGRHRRVVVARGLVTLLARELTTMSYPEIARAMGKKGHSTMIAAERRFAEQAESGAPLNLGTGVPHGLDGITGPELLHKVRARLCHDC